LSAAEYLEPKEYGDQHDNGQDQCKGCEGHDPKRESQYARRSYADREGHHPKCENQYACRSYADRKDTDNYGADY
jgi:hypothetical protein